MGDAVICCNSGSKILFVAGPGVGCDGCVCAVMAAACVLMDKGDN